MPNYAPRVTLSYNDVSGVIRMWSKSCDKMVVYEHEADEEVATTHVHMIMVNCKYKSQDTLCNQFRKLIETERKGNELWSWEHKNYPNPDITYIKYMTKGKLKPVYVKNVSEDEIETYRSQWVDNSPKRVVVSDDNNVVIPAKTKQMTKWEMLCLMYHEYELARKENRGFAVSKSQRNRIIINVLKEHKQVVGLYKVQEFSYALMMHFEPDLFLDALDNSMKC